MQGRDTPTELADIRALIDNVTGLPGRALFFDHLQLAVAQRKESPLAVLVADIDNFKLVNDGLGPHNGDRTLAEVGKRIVHAVGPGDTVARLSADEFAIICQDVGDARDAFAVAERIRAAMLPPLRLGGRDVYVSASIGVAMAIDPWTSPTELLGDAMAALHRAKEGAPGACELFDPLLRARLLERLEVEGGLRRAIERDELRLVYQPEFDIASGEVCAVEALVRWQHPERGLLEPAEFIAVAERSGLIVPLGEWVLATACRRACQWREAGHAIDIAVNVSARQLERPDFAATVEHVLATTGLPAHALCLEVTESAVMSSPEAALAVMAAVRDLGVRLAIDDFGVGFSSLAQLRDLLPVNQLKVDRSFIHAISDDARTRAIVGAVITMAGALGLEAVAEGVESADQIAHLRDLGCDLTQGFYLARPQPAEAIDSLLTRQRLASGRDAPPRPQASLQP